MGLTRNLLCHDLYSWQYGRTSAAFNKWQKSLKYALRKAMPFEARQVYEIGRHLPTADPARKGHLISACEIFERIGATYDLEQTGQTQASTP